MDMIGKIANDYVDISEEIANRQESLDSTGADLCKALIAAGRKDITVRGRVLSVKEIAAKIKITVKKEK